jgi:Winged helix DNA-binding domain
MRRVSVEERRARLGHRQRLAGGAQAQTPVDAAAAVVALHGTDAASVFLSALARMGDGDVGAVERALYEERSLLRVLAMRRTMFVAPVDTAAVLLAACSRDVAARERKRLLGMLAAAGVGGADPDGWLAGAEQAALEALAARGEATATEIAGDDPRLGRTLVLGAGTRYEAKPTIASRVLIVLGAQGRVIRTRPAGGWTSTQFRWAALGDWHPGVQEHGDAPAREELARLWLAAFGPATLADLRWWAGWTAAQARAALAGVATAEVALDGATGLVLAEDAEPVEPAEPWAALLPALDATTMGWKERDWYLGEHGPLLFDRNGNASPTVWWEGRVVGGWAQAPGGELRVRLLEDVGADAEAAIERATGELAARVGAAKLSPRARARSPIEQELLAPSEL